jgi:opacity protein-like surface antigen
LEGFLSYVQQDSKDRYAVGITPLLVYEFTGSSRLVPFFEAGVGVLYTDLDPEDFGSRFNFTPQAGVGLAYEIANQTFLKFSYRYHHISNAGLDEDNSSIDSNFFLIGISFLR